jgi:hypothetical protein
LLKGIFWVDFEQPMPHPHRPNNLAGRCHGGP